jgi:hypothetical protein
MTVSVIAQREAKNVRATGPQPRFTQSAKLSWQADKHLQRYELYISISESRSPKHLGLSSPISTLYIKLKHLLVSLSAPGSFRDVRPLLSHQECVAFIRNCGGWYLSLYSVLPIALLCLGLMPRCRTLQPSL